MKTLFDYMLALGMMITGSVNTISTKAADQVHAENKHGDVVLFNHPFFQTAGMFLGEFLCLLTFRLLIWRGQRIGENRAVVLLPSASLPQLCFYSCKCVSFVTYRISICSCSFCLPIQHCFDLRLGYQVVLLSSPNHFLDSSLFSQHAVI